jgi:hypothetical protein
MLLWSTTEHENSPSNPLSGGARAVRPWGGLWNREQTHPGAARPPSLRTTPPMEGIFMGLPVSSQSCWLTKVGIETVCCLVLKVILQKECVSHQQHDSCKHHNG